MEKKWFNHDTKMIHEVVENIGLYGGPFEGNIDDVIARLQEYKKRYSSLSGTIKISVETEYSYEYEDESDIFVIWNIRPETPEETENRIKEEEILKQQRIEIKRAEFERLKNELEEEFLKQRQFEIKRAEFERLKKELENEKKKK